MQAPLLKDPIRRNLLLKTAAVWLGPAAVPATLFAGRGAAAAQTHAPAAITRDGARPQAASGLQIGDVTQGRAIVWARCDRPARLWVE